jgi:hypothetical protein
MARTGTGGWVDDGTRGKNFQLAGRKFSSHPQAVWSMKYRPVK